MSSVLRSPEITRSPPVRSGRTGSAGRNIQQEQQQSVVRQRSLVEEDPDSERVPARTVCAAFSLLVLGLILLCMSASFFARQHPGALAFFVLGLVVIVPGAHSSFQLFAAFRRWPGYDFGDMRGGGDFV